MEGEYAVKEADELGEVSAGAAAAAGFGLLALHRATTKPAAPQAAGG